MELPDLPLEAELAEIAERAEPGRTAQLAVRHWGWDGRGGATLEATGREFGTSRASACASSATASRSDCGGRRRCAGAGASDAAAPALAGSRPRRAATTAHDLARRLADAHIAAQPFDPAGLLTAAAVAQPRAHLHARDGQGRPRRSCPTLRTRTSDTVAVIAAVVDTSRAVVQTGRRRAGRAKSRAAWPPTSPCWVDDAFVTAVVSEPDDFVWLERRTGWFFLPSVAKNAVVSRVAKVLSVSGAVRLADLHEGIRRDERMREFVMPEYVLAELCARLPGVRVAGDRRLRRAATAAGRRPRDDRVDASATARGSRRRGRSS